MKSLYLNNRLFLAFIIIILLLLASFFYQPLIGVGRLALLTLVLLIFLDIFILYRVKEGMKASRHSNEKLSNGDANEVYVNLSNFYSFEVSVKVIDEVPIQFQIRDLLFKTSLKSGKTKTLHYTLYPTERGEYIFEAINVYVQGVLGLVSRRYKFATPQMIPVYPSYLQMRKYELLAISNRLTEVGIKKIRRVGHNLEFEQIKDYVMGDDIRTINWKASARRGNLMVNHYQDERSQQVYSVIDKGRVMKMPFGGMALMDYAINSSLIISNIAIMKEDKAGLISFSHQIDNFLPASRQSGQMRKVLELLYKQTTNFEETNYERLYIHLKNKVRQRSLILLYTNFESLNSMQRQLNYLKLIAKNHLLVLIFFENTELYSLLDQEASDTEDIYIQTIAEKFAFEKKLIIKELQKFGIYSILTAPEDLNVSVINKYLELKARNLI